MTAEIQAAARSTLALAESALLRGLASAAGQVTPEIRGRIGRAFGVVSAHLITSLEAAALAGHPLGGTEAAGRELRAILLAEALPEGAATPPELRSAADVLAQYGSAAEAVAKHVAAEVVAAVAGEVGTVAAKVGVAFARTLLASFGVPVAMLPGGAA